MITIEERHTITESADKIRLNTKVKRGTETRDQDEVKVQVKGDEPGEVVKSLSDTLAALKEEGIAQTLRDTQPGVEDGES